MCCAQQDNEKEPLGRNMDSSSREKSACLEAAEQKLASSGRFGFHNRLPTPGFELDYSQGSDFSR